MGKLPHGGCEEPDEQQQQRQGEQQLCHRLHQRVLREEQRHRQRRPAPHLTAQISREHCHQRPDLLSAEQHQHDIQRQVGDKWVKVLGSRGAGTKVEDALQRQQPGGAARQCPALFSVQRMGQNAALSRMPKMPTAAPSSSSSSAPGAVTGRPSFLQRSTPDTGPARR